MSCRLYDDLESAFKNTSGKIVATVSVGALLENFRISFAIVALFSTFSSDSYG